MEQLLTADEVAERLRLRPETVKLWTREGLIPAIRITGKVIRYDFAQVEAALKRRSDQRKQGGCQRGA